MTKLKGLIDPVTIIIIVACFAVGGYFMFVSPAIDSPVEQIAESVLHDEGIDIDFSEAKKAKRDSSAQK
jgi:hypothetical protein